ncbi:MAG: sulfatase-like hydrolase/transferase [Actinobacteria bacterium]|nr:sulfatase-like hydrolase/transferase [Actinomycetota bacterium]
MSPPNVFFLAIDSLRADAVFGDHIETPNMDSWAAVGSAFRQCVATTTTTTPSFSSILTGCYPPKHGVRGLQGYTLSPALTTMAEAFASAGYHTTAEVTGPLLPATGILRGFKETNHRQAYRVPFFNWREGTIEKIHSFPEPWFLLLHIWEVHRPYRAPPKFTKRYDRGGYEAAVAATDEWLAPVFATAGDNAIVVITGDHGEEFPGSRVERTINRAIRVTRRRLKTSERWPALDKRMGGQALGHGYSLKEPQVRVPLIIAGPGVSHTTVDQQVRHVDLLPTLTDMCDIPIPPDIDGRSLRPLLEGASLPDEPAYMEAVGVKLEGRHIVGARTPRWKLLQPEGSKPTLYKLDGGAPPDEKHDRFEEHPEVAAELGSFIARVHASEAGPRSSGMTDAEEAVVEQHLRDLGYL